MANELDEIDGPVNEEGRDINVINKRIPVKVGVGSTIFEVILWVLGIIPGLVFLFKKISAKKYLAQLEQKLQHNASQVDNFLEQRVQILQNAAALVQKSVDLDKDTFTKIAQYRSGKPTSDEDRNVISDNIEHVSRQINVAFEQYPDLKAHDEIKDAMKQSAYLQKEITAAREIYNDSVLRWNTAIQEWPTKMIVAAKQGYTTRIPYSVSKETKEAARQVFF